MPSGSCLCGEFKIEYSGEPAVKAACRCLPCRKSSGTPRSFNIIVPNAQFKVLSSNDKKWQRIGDSGKPVTYHNCANCCTLMFVEADSMPDAKIVKLGAMDDDAVIADGNWQAEFYTKHPVPWLPDIAGAEKKEVM